MRAPGSYSSCHEIPGASIPSLQHRFEIKCQLRLSALTVNFDLMYTGTPNSLRSKNELNGRCHSVAFYFLAMRRLAFEWLGKERMAALARDSKSNNIPPIRR